MGSGVTSPISTHDRTFIAKSMSRVISRLEGSRRRHTRSGVENPSILEKAREGSTTARVLRARRVLRLG